MAKETENKMLVKRNDNIVMRNVHDTIFLIDITDNYMDEKGKLYEINNIGAYIWENIDGKTELDVITKNLMQELVECNISFDTIYNDIKKYVYTMMNYGFIEKVEEI